MKQIRKHTRLILFISLLISLISIKLFLPSSTDSSNLKQTKVTLQSSRLSYAARVGTGTSAGSSMIYINTSSSAPFYSVNTENLRTGDSLTIAGTAGFSIVGIVDSDQITVSPSVDSNGATAGRAIYLINKPQQTITFKTASAIPNGKFVVRVPAATANFNDGFPDATGFDFGGIGTSASGSGVGSAVNTTGYTFGTVVARSAGSAGCTSPANYHCYEYSYTGTGGTNTDITLYVGTNGVGNSAPVAPAPANTTTAVAETYTIIVQQLDAGGVTIDQTNTKVGLIESVRVTATVDPTLSFDIAGVTAGTTVCGVPASVTNNTTPLAVPFGTMSLNTFKTLANRLTVSTNAFWGYSVTAVQNDQLGKDGDTSPFIVDTPCDSGPCTHTSQQSWNTATNNGFGYSLQIISGGTSPFVHNGGGTFVSRQFASNIESETPVEIFSHTTKADAHQLYVCYRLSVGSTQEAGDYENMVTYTATASF